MKKLVSSFMLLLLMMANAITGTALVPNQDKPNQHQQTKRDTTIRQRKVAQNQKPTRLQKHQKTRQKKTSDSIRPCNLSLAKTLVAKKHLRKATTKKRQALLSHVSTKKRRRNQVKTRQSNEVRLSTADQQKLSQANANTEKALERLEEFKKELGALKVQLGQLKNNDNANQPNTPTTQTTPQSDSIFSNKEFNVGLLVGLVLGGMLGVLVSSIVERLGGAKTTTDARASAQASNFWNFNFRKKESQSSSPTSEEELYTVDGRIFSYEKKEPSTPDNVAIDPEAISKPDEELPTPDSESGKVDNSDNSDDNPVVAREFVYLMPEASNDEPQRKLTD